jgi:hypothetical protein
MFTKKVEPDGRQATAARGSPADPHHPQIVRAARLAERNAGDRPKMARLHEIVAPHDRRDQFFASLCQAFRTPDVKFLQSRSTTSQFTIGR